MKVRGRFDDAFRVQQIEGIASEGCSRCRRGGTVPGERKRGGRTGVDEYRTYSDSPPIRISTSIRTRSDGRDELLRGVSRVAREFRILEYIRRRRSSDIDDGDLLLQSPVSSTLILQEGKEGRTARG